MHSSGISIWFFIGVLLTVYGGLIFVYGVFEWASGVYPMGCSSLNCIHPCGGAHFCFSWEYFIQLDFAQDAPAARKPIRCSKGRAGIRASASNAFGLS